MIKTYPVILTDEYAIDPTGQTIIHTAVLSGDIELLKEYENDGYDLTVRNQFGQTPSELAENCGNLDVIDFFMHREKK